MRMMKKVMTGMSIAAAALAITAGANAVNADAATAEFSGSQTMDVEAAENATEVWVSYDAIKVKGKAPNAKLTYNAKAKWDVYDADSANDIDISTLKTNKDVYITVSDNAEGTVPMVYHFAPDTRKLSGKYAVSDGVGAVTFKNNKDVIAWTDKEDTYDDAIEYRTAKGSWTHGEDESSYDRSNIADFNNKVVPIYAKQGATLYCRFQATEIDTTTGSKISYAADGTVVSEGAIAFTVQETTGHFASAEAKVKIGKEPGAPSATINYDNGTFKIKATTEYRNYIYSTQQYVDTTNLVVSPSGISGATPVETPGAFAVAPADGIVKVDFSQDGVFEVRTKGAGKKATSKIAVYKYTGVTAPALTEIVNGVKTGFSYTPAATTTNPTPSSITVKTVSGPAAGLGIAYINKKAKTYGKDEAEKGSPVDQVVFTNTNKDETYIVYDKNPFALAAGEKATTIATVKAPTGTKTSTEVKVATSKAKEGEVYIVYASDKKAGKFRSYPTKITLDYSLATKDPE